MNSYVFFRVPFNRIAIGSFNYKDETIDIVYASGVPMGILQVGQKIPLFREVAEGFNSHASSVQTLKDMEELRRQYPNAPIPSQPEFQSSIRIPLTSKDKMIGSLMIVSTQHDYTERDKRLAESVGSQIAGAIANAQLFIAQQYAEEISTRLSQENAVMAEIGRIISSTLNIETVYDRFAEEVKRLIPFDRIAINLINHEGDYAEIVYATGDSSEGPQTGEKFPFSQSVAKEVLKARSRFIIQRKDREEMTGRHPHLSVPFQGGLKSMIIIPLICRDEEIGTLILFSTGHEYTEREQGIAERVGNQIAGAIANAKLYQDRKQAEEALKEKSEELARSNRDLEQFAYVASHDLQEPLRMVTSYVQLLSKRYKDKLDADANDFINFAVDGAVRMWKLINDLLIYSRVGTRAKDLLPTNCETVLHQSLVNLKLTIEENEALITHAPLPTLLADDLQLVQLFQNLIGNAIKFRGVEPPRIHISASPDGNGWLFSVRDNGIGIAPEYSDRIFVIFQRLHGRDTPGTGIGLAVCKKIVERHGGQIWVESEVGNGANFYFTLPEIKAKSVSS